MSLLSPNLEALFTDTEFQHLALPFAGYFGILIPSMVACFATSLFRFGSGGRLVKVLFLILAAASFAITWYFIFLWFIRDASEYISAHPLEGIKGWMANCDLFTGAYMLVTEQTANWWWSVQLLNFVPSMVVFMFASSSLPDSHGLPAAAFLILGMLGAISLCWPLFLIQHLSNDEGVLLHAKRAPWLLSLCMGLSVLSNVVQPFLVGGTTAFDVNLKAIHVLLLLPLLVKGLLVANSKEGASIRHLLAFLAGCSFVSFSSLTLQQLAVHSFDVGATASALISAFWSNECQSSITTDYISSTLTSMVFMVHQIFEGSRGVKWSKAGKAGMLVLVCLAPVLSNGVVFPLFLVMMN
ncbi:hypothetical protein BC830DRAFT_1103055 [Chytriomyces sp. MP71]|nr:hypothetical protein BC830DRAFT_1103055 [Chytriomyces sp. MP71]